MKRKIVLLITLAFIVICGYALANKQDAVTASETHAVCESHQHNDDGDPCRYCNGRGTHECNMCDGTGWRTCSMCGGEGVIVFRNGTKETCEHCNGKGKFKCGYCRHGQRTCNACNGSGVTRHI